jgi:glycosyltransferase involved in cell wall biosynthesis
VSVIVAVRDAERTIDALLGALERQTLPRHRVEVVVADDGSRDGTAARVRARARLVSLPEPVGSYAARNRALEVASGEVVAITDADCVPEPDWLERMLAALERADVVGGCIRMRMPPGAGLPALVDASRRLDQRTFVAEGFVAFASFACRRELLDRVGPFNEALRSNGDREWCLRATAAGARVAYAPEAVVDHPPRTRAADVVRCWWKRGIGRGRTAIVGSGPGTARRRNFSDRRVYVPSALAGPGHPVVVRLREGGFEGGRLDRARIDAATYVLAGAPLAGGYVAGTVAGWLERVRDRGSAAPPSPPPCDNRGHGRRDPELLRQDR